MIVYILAWLLAAYTQKLNLVIYQIEYSVSYDRINTMNIKHPGE